MRPPRSSGSRTPPTDVHRATGSSLGSTLGLNFCANGCLFCHDGRKTSHTRRAQARAIAANRTIHGPWLRPIQTASKAKKGAEIHAQAAGFLSQDEALFNRRGQVYLPSGREGVLRAAKCLRRIGTPATMMLGFALRKPRPSNISSVNSSGAGRMRPTRVGK